MKIKATNKQTGETWFAYNGAEFEPNKAEAEAKACNETWPHILYEVVP